MGLFYLYLYPANTAPRAWDGNSNAKFGAETKYRYCHFTSQKKNSYGNMILELVWASTHEGQNYRTIIRPAVMHVSEVRALTL
jgi:hypothetical protein